MNRIDIYKVNGVETVPESRPTICLVSCGLYSPRIAVVVDGTRFEVEGGSSDSILRDDIAQAALKSE